MKLVQARRVVTSVGDEVIDNGAVLEDAGKIVAVGTPEELRQRAGGELKVIDLGDMTLVPGLFDSHVHLGFDGGPDPVKTMMQQSDEQQLILMLRSARELLRAGVTTARDLGARGHLALVVQEAIETGMAAGPELVVANQPITPTGGHCWFMGGEVDDIDGIRKAVRERHKAGCTFAKVMATGGGMTAGSAPWNAQFSLKELQVLVAEAHRVGMGVAAHAHGAPGIKNAAEAGVTTIEHCSWMTRDESSDVRIHGSVPISFAGYDQSVVEAMVKNNVSVCATINANFNATNSAFGGGRFREERAERIKKMRDTGVRFIAGTDSGINNTPHGAYGGGLVGMGACGFSPAEVIKAATIDAAEVLMVADRKGSLEAGKDADLAAFAGNPFENLEVFENCSFVMTKGKVYDLRHDLEEFMGI